MSSTRSHEVRASLSPVIPYLYILLPFTPYPFLLTSHSSFLTHLRVLSANTATPQSAILVPCLVLFLKFVDDEKIPILHRHYAHITPGIKNHYE